MDRPLLPLALALITSLPLSGQEERPAFERLEAEFRAASSAHRSAIADARARQVPRADRPPDPAIRFYPRFEELARSSRKTPEAARSLAWMFANLDKAKPDRAARIEAGQAILARMLEEHPDDPALATVAHHLGTSYGAFGSAGIDALRTMIERNDDGLVRKSALFALAALLLRDEPTDAARAEARQALVESRDRFGDDRAARLLFEIEHLQVGNVAPDFEATDVEGETFRLSDYRGKVVVLTFWGFW